jgi:hypothetical protein
MFLAAAAAVQDAAMTHGAGWNRPSMRRGMLS